MPKTSDDECVVCPYCGYRHGDAWEWAGKEMTGAHSNCDECGKTFVYWAEYDVTYHARDVEGGAILKAALST